MAFPNKARRAFLQEAGLSEAKVVELEQWADSFTAQLQQLGVGQHQIQLYAGMMSIDEQNPSPIASAFAAYLVSQAAASTENPTPAPTPEPGSAPVVAAAVSAQEPSMDALTPELLGQVIASLLPAAITQALAPVTEQMGQLSQQVSSVVARQQQSRDQVMAEEYASRVQAAASSAFRPADSPTTIPTPVVGANGQPTLAVVAGQQAAAQPLDPAVLQQIAAGAQAASTSPASPHVVDTIVQRLAANHPLLNGNPTESRG